MKKSILLLLVSISASLTFAQKNPDLDKVAATYATQSFKEFYEMLSLPNDAHFPQDIEKNVLWCEQAFAKRGFTTTRLNTPTVPLLLAERKSKNASKTVLIYLQIDGQPVEPSQWQQEVRGNLP